MTRIGLYRVLIVGGFVALLEVLCRAGVVAPATLAGYRPAILVAILILSAVLTPGPDIVSFLVLGSLSYSLFEVSLALARRLTPPVS